MLKSVESLGRTPQTLEVAIDFDNFLQLIQDTRENQVTATVAMRHLSNESKVRELVVKYISQTPNNRTIFQQPYAIITGIELKSMESMGGLIQKGLTIGNHRLDKVRRISPQSRLMLIDLHGNVLSEDDRTELRENVKLTEINPAKPLPLWGLSLAS